MQQLYAHTDTYKRAPRGCRYMLSWHKAHHDWPASVQEEFHELAAGDVRAWRNCRTRSSEAQCLQHNHPHNLIRGMYAAHLLVGGAAAALLQRGHHRARNSAWLHCVWAGMRVRCTARRLWPAALVEANTGQTLSTPAQAAPLPPPPLPACLRPALAQHWLKVFPRESILVLRTEDFHAEPLAHVKVCATRICSPLPCQCYGAWAACLL